MSVFCGLVRVEMGKLAGKEGVELSRNKVLAPPEVAGKLRG
jgi:hypothetical protein